MDKKILWFDVETTGLDPIENDIIQLAITIEVNGEITEEKEFKVRPWNPDKVTQQAVDTHGVGIEEMRKYPEPQKIHSGIVALLSKYCDKFNRNDKFYPGGYNCSFDIDFLNQFFIKANDKYFGSWMNWRRLDPLPLVYLLDYEGKISLPNYKLQTLAEFLGVEIKAHDAISDIRATREIFYKLRGILLNDEIIINHNTST